MLATDHNRKVWLAHQVLPYEPLIRSRLSRLRTVGVDIDDVIQEMYVRLLSVPAVESIRYPRQYAIQTAKAIIIDQLRRSRVVSIVSSGDLEQLQIAQSEVTAEERLEFQDEIRDVAKALGQLPSAYRETLILRRIEGLSQKETAQRLGVTEKTVENHTARGMLMLIKLFGRRGISASASSNTEARRASKEHESSKR